MTTPSIHHIAVLVDDLEAAIARYERLDFAFMEPRSFHIERLVDENGEEKEIDVRLAFSHQGPPHVELLEATGDGIYGPQHVGGLHHVAVLEPDPVARRDELVARGLRPTAAVHSEDGSIVAAYLDPADLAGVRLELLDASIQDAIRGWLPGAESGAAIGKRWYERWNERDFDGAAALVDEGALIVETPTDETFRGPDGSRQENEKWATAFPDGRVEIRNAITSDEAVALELTFSGTNTGPFTTPAGELPPTGRAVTFDYCTLWQIENGRIVGGRHYYDTATVMRQLGLLEAPAGAST